MKARASSESAATAATEAVTADDSQAVAAPEAQLRLYAKVHQAAWACLAKGDHVHYGALHAIEISLVDLRHHVDEAARIARGETLELIQHLQSLI